LLVSPRNRRQHLGVERVVGRHFSRTRRERLGQPRLPGRERADPFAEAQRAVVGTQFTSGETQGGGRTRGRAAVRLFPAQVAGEVGEQHLGPHGVAQHAVGAERDLPRFLRRRQARPRQHDEA